MSTITTRAGKGSALTHNQLDANFKKAAQAKVGAYTVAESDNRDTIECSGTFTVTLPDVATVVAAADTGDFEVTIKNTGSGTITVSCTTGTDTIDGSTSDITLAQNQSKTLKANQAGGGYNVIAYVNTIYEDAFATGSITFSSIASAGGFFDVTTAVHGLGTDDIDFGFKVRGAGTGLTNKFGVDAVMFDVNASFLSIRAPSNAYNGHLPSSLPASGILGFNGINRGASTQDIIVNWWARIR